MVGGWLGGGGVIVVSCVALIRRTVNPRIPTMPEWSARRERGGEAGGAYSYVACDRQ